MANQQAYLAGSICLAVVLTILPLVPALHGAPPSRAAAPSQLPAQSAARVNDPLSLPPRSWAQEAAIKEALLIQHPGSYLRYRMHAVDERGDHVRDQIETPEGSVARLIERDGRALAAEEDAAERERLTTLMNSPAAFAHHVKNEQANKKTGVDLLKLMPDAMLWSYTPGQPQPATRTSSGEPGATEPLVVLDFKPNPSWSPPTLVAQALAGLQGRLWIGPETHQIVRLEGALVRPVNVGWGVVAHLYPGGTVLLEQMHVTGDRWITRHVVEQLVVRALVVKTIRQQLVYDTFSYQVVPALTYQEAIKTLLDTPP